MSDRDFGECMARMPRNVDEATKYFADGDFQAACTSLLVIAYDALEAAKQAAIKAERAVKKE